MTPKPKVTASPQGGVMARVEMGIAEMGYMPGSLVKTKPCSYLSIRYF